MLDAPWGMSSYSELVLIVLFTYLKWYCLDQGWVLGTKVRLRSACGCSYDAPFVSLFLVPKKPVVAFYLLIVFVFVFVFVFLGDYPFTITHSVVCIP